MSEQTQQIEQTGRRIRVGHLVVGVVFLGLAGTWALRAGDVLGGVSAALAVPIVLIVAGAVGLVAMTLTGRRRTTPITQNDAPTTEEENDR